MKSISKTLIAITALVALALAQPPGPGGMAPCNKSMGGPGGKRGFLNPMIIKELNLSAEQKKGLKEYRHKMKKEKIQLRSEIAQLEEDIRFKFSQYPLKKSDIEGLKKKLVDLHGKMTALKIDAMLHFLSKLTKEQHQKFVDLQEQYGFGGGPGGFGGRSRGLSGPGKGKGK